MFPLEATIPTCPACGVLMVKSRNLFTHEKCWMCPHCQFELPREDD